MVNPMPALKHVASMWYAHTHTHTHTHTEEYYSGIKKNKIMPFEVTWMNLKQSKSDRGQISLDITYVSF